MRRIVLALTVAFVPLATLLADDWPQFRGPDRNAISREKGLLKDWPKGGPQLVWTYKAAGLGHSSMAVSKGVVYTLGTDMTFKKAEGKKEPVFDPADDIIIAIDEKSGKELWTAKIGDIYTYKGNSYGDGPRSTPTIDGNFLYAMSGLGQLVCVDIANKGKEVWRVDMVKDLGSNLMEKYGYSEAPLIDGDLLICTPGGDGGMLAALDKKTGKLVWRSKAWTDEAPYSSAVVADIQGVRQVIQTGHVGNSKGGVVAGVDVKTGNVLWKKPIFTGQNSEGISPSPVVSGNLVYQTSGFGGGCRLFEIDNKQKAIEKFKSLKVKNNHGGVVLLDGHIYGHSDPGSWICQELATGDVVWNSRNILQSKSGAVIAAEGLLYLYNDEGEVGLAAADPKGLNLISSFMIPQKSRFTDGTSRMAKVWSHPVIANGHLYLRDREFIFAFKIK